MLLIDNKGAGGHNYLHMQLKQGQFPVFASVKRIGLEPYAPPNYPCHVRLAAVFDLEYGQFHHRLHC